jgi:hypothetical protein
MWTYRCLAATLRGDEQCTRRSTQAIWCFGFQGEKFESATWVEVCGHHTHLAEGYVSSVAIPKRRV